MVAIVPLTIIGGLFLIVAHLPVSGWDARVAPYRRLLQIPVTATFGVLGLVACLAIAYDLGRRLEQDAIVSASMATVVFLMLQIDPATETLRMDGLGSNGLFTAILIALVTVRVQKFFADRDLVIRLPATVPPVVYQSFLSLMPLFFLVVAFWLLRFVLGRRHQPGGAGGLRAAGVRAEHAARHPGLRVAWSRCCGRSGSTATTPWTRSSRRSSCSTWPPTSRR